MDEAGDAGYVATILRNVVLRNLVLCNVVLHRAAASFRPARRRTVGPRSVVKRPSIRPTARPLVGIWPSWSCRLALKKSQLKSNRKLER